MTEVAWKSGLAIQQDPDAIRDYSINLSAWLGAETIASFVPTAINCTVATVSSTTTSVKLRISEVVSGAKVTLRVTTDSGQVDDFTTHFIPTQK